MINHVKSNVYFFIIKFSKVIGSILVLASLLLVSNALITLTQLISTGTQVDFIHIILELGIHMVTFIVGLILIITPNFFTYCELDIFSNKTHKIIDDVVSPITDIIS
ncbi:hypothetical protein D7V64_09135 [Acinetobacter cumulans]|uniref:Uncharacterized protein n=1 Tax=Acinetobacter cumulans TaxID=2136182 RepID=A0A3A8GBM4_9GAMM|nr:hypothetical protein D7V64_09135 [Acinetobacter cumulans]